jgi:hypothetical protein
MGPADFTTKRKGKVARVPKLSTKSRKNMGGVEVQLHAFFTSALQHEYRGSAVIVCASNSVVTSSDLSLRTKYLRLS